MRILLVDDDSAGAEPTSIAELIDAPGRLLPSWG
jgi:hypothetical protein